MLFMELYNYVYIYKFGFCVIDSIILLNIIKERFFENFYFNKILEVKFLYNFCFYGGRDNEMIIKFKVNIF